ncbi:hypothetical protein SAMN04488107_2970 [Geodermatophilus saharensis]|uniref:Uncharacterized protein n=1 Tax=Geodermatophilus saharensis TaxID=1137994 RepID=A0A239FF61_9ACTN|nr:hypothetical protein [Geodermatophilus saharensis]SNS54933.1 hypothetical protein SAMN04488107_2970 [Geodermatophilus saharensis]
MSTTDVRIADVGDLEMATDAFEQVVGLADDSLSNVRPDLNGWRVKMPDRPEIYLVDQGYRRWIPNPATYNNLFRDWNGIREFIDVHTIPVGLPIANGAVLARPSGGPAVYFVDAGVKRWVTSPTAMDRYHLNWDRVYGVPPILLQNISDGPAIN